MDIEELFEAILNDGDSNGRGVEANKKEGIDSVAARYLQKPSRPLKVGDKLRWKKGMMRKRFPEENEHAVIVEILEPKIFREDTDKRSGTIYELEPLDIRAAVLVPDGTFGIYYFDSNRMELVE